MRTSPLQSLQKTTQKTYIIWHHLNLQTQLQIQLEFRGLSSKLHYMHFEKGSNGQTIITMQLLGRNYPKIVYGMAILEFGQKLTKTKEMKGLNCIFTPITKFERAKYKNTITMMISSSSYPKN